MSPLLADQAETARIESQFRFEALVAAICSTLASARPEDIDELLVQALQRIGETLRANRVLLGRTDEHSGELVARAQYRSTDPPFPDQLSIGELNPGLWRAMVAGEVSYVPDVAALPDSEATDRDYFTRIGLRSYIAVPVLIDGSLRFMLAIGNIGEPRDWPLEAAPRLRVLAEVLASAVLRCEAEAVVRANEQLFRALVEHAPVPIMLAPGPDHTPLYFNPAFTRLFGYRREDLPTPLAWWPQAYPDPQYRADRRHMWERLLAICEESGILQDASEAEIRAKDGRRLYAQVRLSLIQGYKMIFFNDLTARRQAEAALRLTQYAVDNNPVMIFRIDNEGKFVYANQTACREFGYSLAELMTMSIWDVSGTIAAADWPERARITREQGGVSLESVYRRKHGDIFPVELHIHHLQFSGEGSFFCFALNISARRAAQEAAHRHTQRMQALAAELTRSEERQRRELASVLHDEIGQNLFAATTQLVSLQNRAQEEKPAIAKIVALLDQISRDTRELTFELCPPVLYQLGLAAALQRLVDQSAKRYHIAMKLAGEGIGPADLNVRGLAYHAARELLVNAAKHSRAHLVTLSVRQDDTSLHIAVEDDGVGLDARKAAAKKDGFGLFQLRERLELLGGSIQIDSEPGRGCRVSIRLPLVSS